MSGDAEPIEAFDEDAVCGCDCGCRRRLDGGNAMHADITDQPGAPWGPVEAGDPRVYLLVCAPCYVGAHPPRPAPKATP